MTVKSDMSVVCSKQNFRNFNHDNHVFTLCRFEVDNLHFFKSPSPEQSLFVSQNKILSAAPSVVILLIISIALLHN